MELVRKVESQVKEKASVSPDTPELATKRIHVKITQNQAAGPLSQRSAFGGEQVDGRSCTPATRSFVFSDTTLARSKIMTLKGNCLAAILLLHAPLVAWSQVSV